MYLFNDLRLREPSVAQHNKLQFPYDKYHTKECLKNEFLLQITWTVIWGATDINNVNNQLYWSEIHPVFLNKALTVWSLITLQHVLQLMWVQKFNYRIFKKPSHLKFILTELFPPFQHLPRCPFRSFFRIKFCYISERSSKCSRMRPSHSLWIDHPNDGGWHVSWSCSLYELRSAFNSSKGIAHAVSSNTLRSSFTVRIIIAFSRYYYHHFRYTPPSSQGKVTIYVLRLA